MNPSFKSATLIPVLRFIFSMFLAGGSLQIPSGSAQGLDRSPGILAPPQVRETCLQQKVKVAEIYTQLRSQNQDQPPLLSTFVNRLRAEIFHPYVGLKGAEGLGQGDQYRQAVDYRVTPKLQGMAKYPDRGQALKVLWPKEEIQASIRLYYLHLRDLGRVQDLNSLTLIRRGFQSLPGASIPQDRLEKLIERQLDPNVIDMIHLICATQQVREILTHVQALPNGDWVVGSPRPGSGPAGSSPIRPGEAN